MKSRAEVGAWLRSRPGKARIAGTASRPGTLPTPAGATALRLDGLDRITRLDAGDQTCSVQCGLARARLDEALAEHRLELPCLGGGTIGGLFASDDFGPAMAGGQSPRSLLLGLEALLADGTPFKSGARVVKSVAGFDVHKAFVGSEGRLFVATELHLRLKPMPRAREAFVNSELSRERALQLLRMLRAEAVPPGILQLQRAADGSHTVRGRIDGRANRVTATVKRLGLRPAAPTAAHVAPNANGDGERAFGLALPSALPAVLAALPDGAQFSWLGGGRFTAVLPDVHTRKAWQQQLPGDLVALSSPRNASPDGATDASAGGSDNAQRLADALKSALDPDGILV